GAAESASGAQRPRGPLAAPRLRRRGAGDGDVTEHGRALLPPSLGLGNGVGDPTPEVLGNLSVGVPRTRVVTGDVVGQGIGAIFNLDLRERVRTLPAGAITRAVDVV